MTPIVAESRLLTLTRVERVRRLTQLGDVMVKVGERVNGHDVVCREIATQLRPIPLARYLRLKESALQKHLEKLPGEVLQERDIIASKPEYLGTLRRIYRAPGNGRFISLQGSWITLDLSDTRVELRALYPGTVTKIVPNHSVTIQAVGSLIQGAWGIGDGFGELKIIAPTADTVTLEEHMTGSLRGGILLAGAGISNAAIRHAADEGALGLIVGSLRPSQIELVMERKIATLALEGFGERAMVATAFQMLSAHVGEEIVINASLPADLMQPEIFIPAQTSGGATMSATPPALQVQPGTRVRLIAEPQRGALGKISALISAPQFLENGLSAWGVEVELGSGEKIFVPFENLELIDG